MPIYRTGPDVSLDDLVATTEASGERIVQIIPRQNNGFIVVTEQRPDDNSLPRVPSWAKETR